MSSGTETSLPIFGADAEGAWLFSEEKLAEMRAAAHKSATDAISRFMRTSENSIEATGSIAPSPGKKAKKELDEISLAEDLMLQVQKSDDLSFAHQVLTVDQPGILSAVLVEDIQPNIEVGGER